MNKNNQTYTTVKRSELVSHNSVPKILKEGFASINYSPGLSRITSKGIHELTVSHPPLAIINAQDKIACIGLLGQAHTITMHPCPMTDTVKTFPVEMELFFYCCNQLVANYGAIDNHRQYHSRSFVRIAIRTITH